MDRHTRIIVVAYCLKCVCADRGVEVVWQVSTHQSLLMKERMRKKVTSMERAPNVNPHFTDWPSLRLPQTSESLWPWNQIIASSAWEKHMFRRGNNTDELLESIGDTGKGRKQIDKQKKQRCKVKWSGSILFLFYRHNSQKIYIVHSSQHYSAMFCLITSHRVTMWWLWLYGLQST